MNLIQFQIAAALLLLTTAPLLVWGLGQMLRGGSSTTRPDSIPSVHGTDRRTNTR